MDFKILKNKIFIIFLAIIFLVSLRKELSMVCTYNDGYRLGLNERNASCFPMTYEAKIGYEQGLNDAYDDYMYDEGYNDALQKIAPKYLKDDDYMEGYNDVKKYRQ